jgi:hypothetical protein
MLLAVAFVACSCVFVACWAASKFSRDRPSLTRLTSFTTLSEPAAAAPANEQPLANNSRTPSETTEASSARGFVAPLTSMIRTYLRGRAGSSRFVRNYSYRVVSGVDREDDLLEEEVESADEGYQRAGSATRVRSTNYQLVSRKVTVSRLEKCCCE